MHFDWIASPIALFGLLALALITGLVSSYR